MKRIFILLMILVNTACKDVIDEVRLYEDSVDLVAPVNDAVLNDVDVIFSWNSVDGASEYVIQIATPDFTNPNQIVTDTTVAVTNFSTTLSVTTSYEWRVKAINPNYETAYSTRSLTTL